MSKENSYTLADLRAADPTAWSSFVEDSKGSMRGAVRRVAGDQLDPQDMAQEAFLGMWRSGVKDGNPVAYATTAARNASITHVKRRVKYVPFEDGGEDRIVSTAPSVEDEALGPVEGKLTEAGQQVFHTALEQVGVTNSDQRQVLVLLAQGYKDTEIAVELGWKLATVRTRIRRARQTLKSTEGSEAALADALGILETK